MLSPEPALILLRICEVADKRDSRHSDERNSMEHYTYKTCCFRKTGIKMEFSEGLGALLCEVGATFFIAIYCGLFSSNSILRAE